MSEPEIDPGAFRRTHPLTPLLTGWKIVVGVIAVLAAQNIATLVNDFTLTRALIGLGVLAAAVVLAVALSFLGWWFTKYAVTDAGVALHKGLLTRSREVAPRARIESVSVERPLVSRVLGLAKVRVEIAGGSESYLDIQYVRSRDADDLRRRILAVARDEEDAPAPASAPAPTSVAERMDAVLGEGDDEGRLIARIPTSRLLRSLVRDADFLLGAGAALIGVAIAIVAVIWSDGFSIIVIVGLLPTAIAVPKYIFGRIEAGWGFVSRLTERGLRMRRGLANTRTDTIASGRIQRFEVRRPLLWRRQGWTAVTVTVAGIDDSSENGARSVLPVGTPDELALTVGHLAAPLGTDDDLATLERLLALHARDIDGPRPPHRLQPIARRTQVAVLLPGAVILRSGLLSRTLEIVPRERIQQVGVEDGPLARRLGTLDLKIAVAGQTVTLSGFPRADVLHLQGILSRDAATLRRYADQEHWPRPALAGEDR